MKGHFTSSKRPKSKKRKVEIVVISDIHLGTYGCHAKELVSYLKSISPKTVVLNGDIIDGWQFSKRYFPKSHLHVIRQIVKWGSKGVRIYYIPGNHDELFRKFSGFKMGPISITNKLVLEIDQKKVWIFHGDVFDVTMKHSRWLTHLGSRGYDLLILINTLFNWFSLKLTGKRISLSRKIKNGVKSAVSYLSAFEKTCAEVAIDNGYDYVLCGHIHHPEIRTITTHKGQVIYMNSGDWVENLTALEYERGEWKMYHFRESALAEELPEAGDEKVYMTNRQVFEEVLDEFRALNMKSSADTVQKKYPEG